MTYDLIIIGAGPAGCGATIYSARKQLKTLLITPSFGGQSDVSSEIYNWIGTKAISGTDLARSMEEHVRSYVGEYLTIVTKESATKLSKNEDGTFSLSTDKNIYMSRSILITAGSGRRKLSIPGADTFENKGIVYCASCDGPLFSGQDVAVIGGGNAGFETAMQLLAYCKHVTLLNRSASFKADAVTIKHVASNPHMTILAEVEPIAIIGEKFVTGLTYKSTKTGEETTIPVTGIFVEIGQIPNSAFVDGFVNLDKYKRIIVDHRTQRTSINGIWAAGDITDGLYHQNNISVGDAIKAIENIYLYIKAGG